MAIMGSVWFVVLGLLALVLAAGAALAWLIRAAASTVGESVGESVASAVVAVVQEGLQSTDPSVVATCLGLEVSRGRLSTDQAVERMMSRKLARGAPESHRYFKEGLEQLQAAAGDDPARVLFQALLTLAHAQALSEIGRQAEAKDLLDAALPFVLQHGSPSLRIFALMNHGALLSRLNQPEQALDRVSEALELARHEGQSALIAECLIARGDGLRGVGRWDDALKDFEESLEILRHEDLPDELSKCLTRRGGMLLLREQPTEALHDFDEALPLLRDHGRPEELARCSMNRALAMSQVGRGAEALADYDGSSRWCASTAVPTTPHASS